jgi:hypothetical protein
VSETAAEGEAAPETGAEEATAEGAETTPVAAPEPALPPQKTFEDLQKEREKARQNSELFGSSKVSMMKQLYCSSWITPLKPLLGP